MKRLAAFLLAFVAGAAFCAPVHLRGTYLVVHEDDFDGGKGAFHRFVVDAAGKRTELHFAKAPRDLKGGSQVDVLATMMGSDSADVSSVTVLSTPTVQASPHANTVLVIMGNFSNTTAPSYSSAQAQMIMDNSGGVGPFFLEASYGQQTLTTSVTPTWLALGIAATCDYNAIRNAAEPAAKAAGYDPASYDYVVFLFPQQSCGWAGLSYVGWPHRSWINGVGYFITRIVAHELGHAFGLYHSGSLSCGTDTIRTAAQGGCTAREYGSYNTMGSGPQAWHYAAEQKQVLGWIPPAPVQADLTQTVSYTLDPLEEAGGTTYAVKIPTADPNRTYWVEYRKPEGFDTGLTEGVYLWVSNPFEFVAGSDDVELLTAIPGSSVQLPYGATYNDYTDGVSITVGPAPVAPPPPPPPAGTSPDGTTVPPASSIVDANGGVWTLSTSGDAYGYYILLNGASAANGRGVVIEWKNSQIKSQNAKGQWWLWTGSGWSATTAP